MKESFIADVLLQAGAGAPRSSLVSMLLPLVAMFAIFYFLVIRPQKKQQKEHKDMLAELKKGDKVQTIGGILGTIVKVKDKSILIRVDENSTIELKKDAVSSLANPSNKKDKSKKDIENKDDNSTVDSKKKDALEETSSSKKDIENENKEKSSE